MTKLSLVFIAVFSIACAAQKVSQTSDLRKAFEHHEKLTPEEVTKYYPAAGGAAFVLSERWKNYQKYAKTCPAIAEVVSVQINKTLDTGSFVVRMIGPSAGIGADGFEHGVCSLWINGAAVDGTAMDVNDYTSY